MQEWKAEGVSAKESIALENFNRQIGYANLENRGKRAVNRLKLNYISSLAGQLIWVIRRLIQF
ncbi:hypothetical protein Lser_V15G42540 [Lactuca serriola]